MALTFLTNAVSAVSPVGAKVLFDYKTLIKARGYTIPASGDGLSAVSTSGDVITHSGDGDNGMNNTNAWFTCQPPTGGRQQCIQLGHVNGYLWWQYSKSAGFVGGTALPNVTPTAADAKNVLGTGSGFSGAPFVTGGIGSVRYSIAVDDAAPWGWWILINPTAGAGQTHPFWMQTILACDPVLLPLAGDTDPYMFLAAYGPDLVGNPVFHGTRNTQSAFAKYQPYEGNNGAWGYREGVWQCMPWHSPVAYHANHLVNGIGVNPDNGKDQFLHVMYGAAQPPAVGYKGLSSLFFYTSASREFVDDYHIVTARDYRDIGGMAVHWDGSVPLL